MNNEETVALKALEKADYPDIKYFLEHLATDDQFRKFYIQNAKAYLEGRHPDAHKLGLILLDVSNNYWINEGYNDEA